MSWDSGSLIFLVLAFLHVSGQGLVMWVDKLAESFEMRYGKTGWYRKVRYFHAVTRWRINDFISAIRAKCILYWHLSWLGEKVDRLFIYYEIVKKIEMDRTVLPYLSNREMEAYKNNCEERKNFAYELYLY